MIDNSTAKELYDKAVEYLKTADAVEDVNSALCYTSMGQLALELAKFAVANHGLVMGVPGGPGIRVASEPPGGPKLWGSP